jgi:glutamyl-Q tRNA(Asp) synthetase
MTNICGRFAPTPSGPLHFGSLVTALASFLSIRSRGGRWLVRIEDIDHERCILGAAENILQTLQGMALKWDDEVVFQSRREDIYGKKVEDLLFAGLAYRCSCSRKEIGDGLGRGVDGAAIYPGTCKKLPKNGCGKAVRFCVRSEAVVFDDAIMGICEQNVAKDVGDFVVFRADGCFAYHLAVVVDDALQGVTEVMRGADLLASTARQILLQEAQGFFRPVYCHLPLVLNDQGEKLSKQTLAEPVLIENASDYLVRALIFLGQPRFSEMKKESPERIISWAIDRWSPNAIPKTNGLIPRSY